MKKTINGKQVKITRAGYIYIDGKKVSDKIATPLNFGDIAKMIDDSVIVDALLDWINRHYKMC